MKKILLSLIALTAAMSMNAQIIKLMKNGEVVATYSAAEADGVEYEEQPITGAAMRKGSFKVVNWVQLWEDGPKFAEYNIEAGFNEARNEGGSYCWGGSTKGDSQSSKQGICTSLSGDNDTATKLWGKNWRMPTRAELQGLFDNCDSSIEKLYDIFDGIRFTGKGIYAKNSIFLPIKDPGAYYSSESDSETTKPYCLGVSGIATVDGSKCLYVRAVLTDGELVNEYSNEDDNEQYNVNGEDDTTPWF